MSSSNSLCSVCQGIIFKPWQGLTNEDQKVILSCNDEYDEDEDDKHEVGKDRYGDDLFYVHHPNLSTLQKSADEGCQFCYLMCYGAVEQTLLQKDDETYF